MNDLPLPVPVRDVLRGVGEANRLPENEVQKREKPRASSVSGCARACVYDMHATPESTDWERDEMPFTQEQGRLAEDITIGGLEASGELVVYNRQVELPDSSPVTGHPDGELGYRARNLDEFLAGDYVRGLRDGEEGETWSHVKTSHVFSREFASDGRVWGFEHKHYGEYGFTKILRGGLYENAGDVVDQVLLYGAALGWDACLVAITSQDASVIRKAIRRNLEAKKPKVRWAEELDPNNDNPKLLLFALDLRPLYALRLPLLDGRAAALAEAARVAEPWAIMPEGNPFWQESDEKGEREGSGFPCSYCEHWTKCCDDLKLNNPSIEIPKVRNE